MRRYIIYSLIAFLVFAAVGLYYFNQYWIHRYDELIARQASVYRLDERLVWSIIYEETYFRAWQIGAADEVGLMQITPTVAREWAKETGFKDFEIRVNEDVITFLRDPERNIQVGCWYLERLRGNYRTFPAEKAMTLAAYNAGASRVEEWTRGGEASKLSREEFIQRINIPSTRAYVTSILERYDDVEEGKRQK
jgi:soluble lytic murein transglycosylase